MELIDFAIIDGTLVLRTTSGKIRLQVCTEKIIHVQMTLQEKFSEKPSLMILSEAMPIEKDAPYKVKLRRTTEKSSYPHLRSA